MTIFEAVAQSGIQNPSDLRNDVWIIREDSGKRNFAKIDLTSKSIFESPYFYLKNNDFIYIKQNKLIAILGSNSPIKLAVASFVTFMTLFLLLRNL